MLQCNIFYDFTPAKTADISKKMYNVEKFFHSHNCSIALSLWGTMSKVTIIGKKSNVAFNSP